MNENKQIQVNTLASVYYFLFHAFANNRPFISDNYHTIKKSDRRNMLGRTERHA